MLLWKPLEIWGYQLFVYILILTILLKINFFMSFNQLFPLPGEMAVVGNEAPWRINCGTSVIWTLWDWQVFYSDS